MLHAEPLERAQLALLPLEPEPEQAQAWAHMLELVQRLARRSSWQLGLLALLLLLRHYLHWKLDHDDLRCVRHGCRRGYLGHDDVRRVRHGADDLCGLAVAQLRRSRPLLPPTRLLPRLRSTATQLLALD